MSEEKWLSAEKRTVRLLLKIENEKTEPGIKIVKFSGILDIESIRDFIYFFEDLDQGFSYYLVDFNDVTEIHILSAFLKVTSVLKKKERMIAIYCGKTNKSIYLYLALYATEFQAFPLFSDKDAAIKQISKVVENKQKIPPGVYNEPINSH